jgi:hypothetical protein
MLKKEQILAEIAKVESDWEFYGYPKLTLRNGWSQAQSLKFKGRNARYHALQAAVWYGRWRALHDVLGSPYGYDARHDS